MSAATWTSGKIQKLTKNGGNPLAVVPRALWVGVAGTATVVDMSGTTHNDYPLKEGLNPIRITELGDGGTADDIWALY